MANSNDLVQNIAVFGEAGSGKTVLLSSFYGAAQEPEYLKQSLFRIIADSVGQGSLLHRNYLGMRDSAKLPPPNRFAMKSYSFSVKMKGGNRQAEKRPVDALRLVWHDYPGEWFEKDVSGAKEEQRRVEGFRSLLSSNVALVLVDAQKLIEHKGEEERYLKSLFGNLRNGILGIKGDILAGGKPLVQFPRIWILVLSKADLLPDMSVFDFRDLLTSKAGGEIQDLRDVLEGFVEGKEALSVGEDFLLLSSARFGAERIEVENRIGVDLVLPIAAMLPFQRHLRWAKMQGLPKKVAAALLNEKVAAIAAVLVNKVLPGHLRLFQPFVAMLVNKETIEFAQDQIAKFNAEAETQGDQFRQTLTGFQMLLDKAEADDVLLQSHK